MSAGTCRSCDAPVVWVKTPNGHVNPLDADPTPDGNVVIIDDVATTLGPLELATLEDDVERYVSHFATCPQADEWRKP